MRNRVLNITNGEYFNEYFLSRFGGVALPFCENMMDGTSVEEIYSKSFIRVRAQSLGVSEAEYESKACVFRALREREFAKLCLWFGKDTFCQANLLTLLAYLEQIGYRGEVELNYIDDEDFSIIESGIVLRLGGYGASYREIFLQRRKPSEFWGLVESAFDLYFDYHDRNGALAELVRANTGKDKQGLVRVLIENSKAYGLSVEQAERLIEVYGNR